MLGRTIGKYRIVDQIGRGGMGTVYLAVDETLDRRVALKILNADLIDQDAVERFRREATTLAKLNHGRIGAIHELARDGHDLLMVMEFLEGETFEKLIERGPMSIPRALALCGQVLEALQYAHAAGVIHRDLKPANLMLTPTGDVKVMDFGIARVQGSEHLTTNGFMVGTPAYMAPEQVRGEEVDPRMDLYSIAVVLYRMLTHRLPFQGDTTIAMIHAQLSNPPTPPRQFRADLPDWIVAVLERGLAKTPGDRFQTATEFRQALESGPTVKRPLVKNVPPGDSAETLGPMQTPPLPVASPTVAPIETTPTSTPSAAPVPVSTDATVTLRAPQLATAGVLIALLIVGAGVLAFIAFRRPATTVSAPQTAAQPEAAPPTAADVPPPSVPESASTVSTPATPETTPPAPSTAAAPPFTPATSPAAPTGPTPKPPAAGASGRSAGAPSTTTNSLSTTVPGGRGNAPETPEPVAPAAPAVPAVPAVPAAASLPAENFGDIKTLVVDGTRSREVDALLSLEPGNLIVRSRSDGSVLRSLPYTAIAAATYARAKRPRGQAAPGALDVPENVGGAGFLGGARHWLTLQTPSEFLIVRLEDRNVIRVINGIEARTGNKVLRSRGE